MADKFVLMDLDDRRSKKVAEVLGSKTCKKMLDYLSETKEASQKDISDALGIPLNTVEYNLKKLLASGLVEKTKNFFWSKKGRRIVMYKLAKKHIIISPKNKKPSATALRNILPVIVAVILLASLVTLLDQPVPPQPQDGMNKFSSASELKQFLKENTVTRGGILEGILGGANLFKGAMSSQESSSATSADSSSGTSDYSDTNIQVEGVDEADIVKTDGKYIYTVSDNSVLIIDAYPAEDMEILSEIRVDNRAEEIFVNDDKLVIFTRDYDPIESKLERCIDVGCVLPQQEPKTVVYVYDISDRKEPELENEISVSGNYFDSRMIGDYVYVINNQYVHSDVLPAVVVDGVTDVVEPNEISYYDIKDMSFQYTIILAIDLDNGDVSEETMLTGMSQNLYVSQDNIYTVATKYARFYDAEENEEKTTINKFSINKDEIEYVATGEVPGHVLNQFSMDEYDDNFRIATTVRRVWREGEVDQSQNNVYVLDEDLEVVGELEGLAPGESIYSVRFMGERGYVVTFKKVDPLFVIDLEDPENPRVLGKLKIPGYSDYLHPYDEDHIIGIGKDTEEAEKGDFAWYQGVKMAIFDVSDVENPIELHKVVIGDRGTDSEALQDHKAFLFDREKELLVLPITLAEIQGEKTKDNQYGEQTFQGAYVYDINLEDGFDLKGRITHHTEEDELKRGSYYGNNKQVRRSLYMDDTLYTISNSVVKANDLDDDDLDEVGFVEF
ncbi:helix-turn-helix domain-containing protein [Candidatus Pacearchaeota archaeon]|nr:helix-turn-helix domain-containing protein [Candidatus Pacearchaeota archaeon]